MTHTAHFWRVPKQNVLGRAAQMVADNNAVALNDTKYLAAQLVEVGSAGVNSTLPNFFRVCVCRPIHIGLPPPPPSLPPQNEGYFPAINCSASDFVPQPPSPVDPVTGKTLFTLHYQHRHNHKLRLRGQGGRVAAQANGTAQQQAKAPNNTQEKGLP